MEPSSHVYIGRWTNWSEGPIKGASITLTDAGGAYLIAFLALFVRLAGQHSWGMLCYLVFQYRHRADSTSYDPFRAVSQSILRNTNVDTSAAWQFLSFPWEHKSAAKGRLLRSLAWMLFAATHAIAFVVAGVFVSKVAESGSTSVLLRGLVCGVWQDPAPFGIYSSGSQSDIVENSLWVAWSTQQILAASDFSRQCYNASSPTSALASCNAYGPALVQWNTTTDDSCPFDSAMCRKNQVVRLDSGLLDSLQHFGVNAQLQDRVKYRRVVECSPLVRDNFVSDLLNVSEVDWPQDNTLVGGLPQQNGLFQEYRYGPNVLFNMTSTYIWNNGTMGTLNWGDFPSPIYVVGAEISMPDCHDCSTFTPIDKLYRTDADVVIYFLLSSAQYIEPVNDPWFQATTPYTEVSSIFVYDDPYSLKIYTSDYKASVMGCTQQFQYCNHDGSKCSELRGEGFGGGLVDSILAFSDSLDLNAKQASTLSRIAQASWSTDMYSSAFSNGPGNLLAGLSSASTPAALPSLADDQWILEMQHYFLTGLTSMQMRMAAYAVGPPDPNSSKYITKPTADEGWMCTSQMVQRKGYSNFSVLGIAIVVVIGGLFILINLSLPTLCNRSGHYSAKEMERTSSWEAYHHISRTLRRHERESMYQLTTIDDDADPDPGRGTSNTTVHTAGSVKNPIIFNNNLSRDADDVNSTKTNKKRLWDISRHRYQQAHQE